VENDINSGLKDALDEASMKPFNKIKKGDTVRIDKNETASVVTTGNFKALLKHDDSGAAKEALDNKDVKPTDKAVVVEFDDGETAVYSYADMSVFFTGIESMETINKEVEEVVEELEEIETFEETPVKEAKTKNEAEHEDEEEQDEVEEEVKSTMSFAETVRDVLEGKKSSKKEMEDEDEKEESSDEDEEDVSEAKSSKKEAEHEDEEDEEEVSEAKSTKKEMDDEEEEDKDVKEGELPPALKKAIAAKKKKNGDSDEKEDEEVSEAKSSKKEAEHEDEEEVDEEEHDDEDKEEACGDDHDKKDKKEEVDHTEATTDVILAKVKEEIDEKGTTSVEESIEELISSDDSLSEEFKSKAAIIFEAAVSEKVSGQLEEIQERAENTIREGLNKNFEQIVSKVDEYLTFAVETYVENNTETVESQLRTEITESFVSSLKDVFEQHYIEMPEGKLNLYDDISEKAGETKTKLDETAEKLDAAMGELIALKRDKIIREASEDLYDTQAERLSKLTDNLDFVDEETFAKKVDIIKETYFTSNGKSEDETTKNSDSITRTTVIEEEDKREINSVMGKYVDAISRHVND
jgi:hypothetical protein